MIDMVESLNAVPPLLFQNGLKFDADGRIVVTTTNPIASWNNGLAFDVDGNLCVVLA